MSGPNPPSSTSAPRPFFTLRSVLVLFVLALVCAFGAKAIGEYQSAAGALAAVVFAVGLVSFVLTWIGGLVFALRARSFFWLFAVCLLGPLGSLACAWFVTASAGMSGGPKRP